MSNINPSLPAAWAAAVPELALRQAGAVAGGAADALRWFDMPADNAELLRAPAGAGTETAAELSERFLGSLLQG